jgi:hypothetical protein
MITEFDKRSIRTHEKVKPHTLVLEGASCEEVCQIIQIVEPRKKIVIK